MSDSPQDLAQVLLNATPALALLVEPDGTIVAANEESSKRFGQPVPALVGRCFYDLLPPDLAQSRRAVGEEVNRTARPHRFEDSRDGSHFDNNVYPIVDSHGVVTKMAVFSYDITDQKRAEAALRASEERFRGAFENAGVGVALVALDGHFQAVNPFFCDLIGYSEEELLATTFSAITHPEDVKIGIDHQRRLISGEIRSASFEKRYLHKSGRVISLNVSPSVLSDADGKPVCFVSQFQNITEKKQADAALRERNLELARANRRLQELAVSKDEFVATVSHELRTPLVTGLGYLEMLLEGAYGPISSEADARLRIALRNLKRLSELIDGLLGYQRLVDGAGARPNHVPLDVASLLEEVRSEALVRFRRAEPSLQLDVTSGLPPVVADPELIHRVLSNLVDNACKHAGAEATVHLRARANDSGTSVRIAVVDDGRGIPDSLRERIFEPFVREEGNNDGYGLGLAIVRTILKAHGATAELESAEKAGTSISFELDVANAPVSTQSTG